jgi:hypothetical protein
MHHAANALVVAAIRGAPGLRGGRCGFLRFDGFDFVHSFHLDGLFGFS